MRFRKSLFAIALALLMVSPVAIVGAQGPQGDQGQAPDDQGPPSDDDRAEDNETEENETDDDAGDRQRGRNATDDDRGPPEEADDRREEGQARAEEARKDAEERRERYRGFTLDNGTVQGRYVSFQVDNGTLTGIHLERSNLTVFETITLAGDPSDPEVHGATFELESDTGELKLIDTPNALILTEAEDNASLQLALADGITYTRQVLQDAEEDEDEDEADDDHEADDEDEADDDHEADDGNETAEPEENETAEPEENETAEPEENETAEMEDDDQPRVLYTLRLPGNRTAYLAGEGLTDDGNGTFTVTDEAQFRLQRPEAHGPEADDDEEDDERGPPGFVEGRASRAQTMRAEHRDRVQQAIAQGQVAVEVYADNDTGEPVAVELDHVRVRNVRAFQNAETKAQLEIEAEDGAPGTVVVLNLDREDLGNLTLAEAADELGVRYDGMNATPADDLDDVLDWQDDNGTAEYLLLVGGQEIEVLVSVPHFSPHTIEVYQVQSNEESQVDDPGAQTPISPLLGLAALAGAAIATYRRRDRKDL